VIPVVFWKLFERPDSELETTINEARHIPLMRYYNVFNEMDTTIKPLETVRADKIKECENIVADYSGRPVIQYGIPSYNIRDDIIYHPNICNFETEQAYYATLFHELSHSTGHEKRLNRIMKVDKQTEAYAEEELIAEISACFLCAKAGIENKTFENSTAYIQSWVSIFKEKKHLLISLASKAQKSFEYIGKEKNG